MDQAQEDSFDGEERDKKIAQGPLLLGCFLGALLGAYMKIANRKLVIKPFGLGINRQNGAVDKEMEGYYHLWLE